MNKTFALKLAINNIKNNRKFYLPYFLAATGIIAMFYIICFLAMSKGVAEMSLNLTIIMQLGIAVMGIFSVIFLFYINSFLMKRRKKEIGLYNILGMEKRHIGLILAIENLFIAVSAIFSGLVCGILFSKLVHLVLTWLFKSEPPFGIEISFSSCLICLALFGGIFIVTMVVNQMSIHLAKPIELLYGGNVGEKEPKTRVILAIIGILCLGSGYYIAITTESPLEAIFMFFIAVVLVIIGTYCLFTAGSVAILKALKKNKKFYYKPANFTAVSGLIYRMKQNAVGLANICILSTMVLIMVSGTVSLFVGIDDVINHIVPGDVNVLIASEEKPDMDKVVQIAEETADELDMKIDHVRNYHMLSFTTLEKDGTYQLVPADSSNLGNTCSFVMITEEDYTKMTGKTLGLTDNQVAVFSEGRTPEGSFKIGTVELRKSESLDDFPNLASQDYIMSGIGNVQYVVLSGDEILGEINRIQKDAYEGNGSTLSYQLDITLQDSDSAKQEAYVAEYTDRMYQVGVGNYSYMTITGRSALKKDYDGMVGGFLFLGIFLGIVFTFAAALIIYYKQISEGYYDKDKFEIMQKVGMSKREVKRTIRKQVLLVFFVPLVMAGIHVAAAFKMITRLLMVFGMYNVPLFALCTVVTFAAFAVIYALVYLVTAREYYKIVG